MAKSKTTIIKMKGINTILATGAILAALASCSESELYLCGCEHEKDNAACLQISGVDKEGYTMTRTATEKSAFANGDAIGIWVEDATTKGNYNGTAYDNIKLTNTNGTWTLGTKVTLIAKEAKVYALYPYNADMTDKTVTLSLTDATDYLYDVKSGISSSNPSTGLSMKHIRSLLVVNLNKGNYAGTGAMTSSTITGSGLSLNGSYSLTDNKFTSSEGSGKITMTDGTIPTSGALTEQWFVFTKAGASKSPLSFAFTIDGVTFKTAKSQDNVSFEPGKKYIFNLTLSKDYHIDVASVDVEAWTETDESVTVTDE